MPAVSIIVPVYNVEEALLRSCIESALAQTFTDFELILVDDASTDGSAAVCEEYLNDKRVNLLRLPQNGGLANARNQGVTISTGEYITFLDADDRLVPETIERLLNIAAETTADIVIADYQSAKPHHETSTSRKFGRYTKRPYKSQSFTPTEAVADILYQRQLNNSAWGKLYSRKLCEAEPFRSGWYEDLRTFPHIFLRANRIAYTPQKLYLYTDNPGSYLHTFNTGRAVVLDVTEEIVAFMEANYPKIAPAARDRALSAAFNIFNLMTVHKVYAPEIGFRCKATIRRYRRESLLNPQVRLKNKLGILLTYIGGFSALRLAAFFLQKP